mgnify:CR=1 FL=1
MSEDRTVRLHRILTARPEKVFRAFTDADALVRWMPPNGFTAKVHSIDVREGGTFRMSFTNFSTGNGHSFGGTYLEVEPGKRLHYVDRFDDPNLPGEMTVTVTFREVVCGCELTVTQENIPAAIPLEFCYLGWQQSLDQLARVVEPEIPD